VNRGKKKVAIMRYGGFAGGLFALTKDDHIRWNRRREDGSEWEQIESTVGSGTINK
jgi:hypothetical protein